MERYTYNKWSYLIGVKITGLFYMFLLLTSIICIGLGIYRVVMCLVFIVSAYASWNNYIAKVNSEIVEFSKEEIIFTSYGRKDEYFFSEIKTFQIREFPSAGKMYIRINGGGLKRGRYWIQTKNFEKGTEMFRKLLDIEFEKHPETIKARARKVNTEYLAKEK